MKKLFLIAMVIIIFVSYLPEGWASKIYQNSGKLLIAMDSGESLSSENEETTNGSPVNEPAISTTEENSQPLPKTSSSTSTLSTLDSPPKNSSTGSQVMSSPSPQPPEYFDDLSTERLPEPKLATEQPEKSSVEAILMLFISGWSNTPLNLKLWYLFFFTSLILYVTKLKQYRKPLLFFSVIFLGYYLGEILHPIGTIFDLTATKKLLSIGIMVMAIIPIALSLIWGRLFCGWVCPFGAIQEFLHQEKKGRILSPGADRILKYLKFLVLFGLGALIWQTSHNWWIFYEPFKVLFTFQGAVPAVLMLAGIMFLSIFISRPFCKYLCPLGAILVITSKIAPFKMRADAGKCMVCRKCGNGICPMDAISAENPEIDLPDINTECIKCSQCQSVCRETALRITIIPINRVRSSSRVNGSNNLNV